MRENWARNARIARQIATVHTFRQHAHKCCIETILLYGIALAPCCAGAGYLLVAWVARMGRCTYSASSGAASNSTTPLRPAWTNRATSTAYAGTPCSAWTNNAATSARTSCSTWTNRATQSSGGSAADGATCLASACGSRITCTPFQTRAATRRSHQASYKKGCRSR